MSDSITLYDTTSAFLALLDLMEHQEEDPSPAQEQVIQRTIAEHVQKVDRFAQFLTHLDAQADLADAEIKRLTARKKTIQAHADRLKAHALRIMDEAGWEKLEGETSTLKIRLNPPAVNIIADDLVPAEFKTIRQEVVIDKNAVKARLKAGGEVPGAMLTQGRKVVVA